MPRKPTPHVDIISKHKVVPLTAKPGAHKDFERRPPKNPKAIHPDGGNVLYTGPLNALLEDEGAPHVEALAPTKPTRKKAAPTIEAAASKTGILTIPGVQTERLTTLVIGATPLIVNKFAQKYIDQILAKHQGAASKGRERKVPLDNFNAARHRLSGGDGDGFPASGLKACIVSGFSREAGVAMTRAKGGIRVSADDERENLVRIICPDEPEMREDVVRNESGVVDIRHRPQYWPWAMLLTVEYLPALMSAGQLLQAISMAGFTNGIGEWRPASRESKSGTFGTFRLATPAEVEAYEQGVLFDGA